MSDFREIQYPGQKYVEKFWNKCLPIPESGCWAWTGTTSNSSKRGIFSINNKRYYAYRVSWAIHRGFTPANLMICHHCDNPWCVNPDHLFPGTCQDNVNDKIKKGRQTRGESHGPSKLTEQSVREIRESDLSCLKLGRKYGVNANAIWMIRKGMTWKHIKS